LSASTSIDSSISDWEIRRAKFVCDEALFKDKRYDSSVRYTLRVLSNMATIGCDGVSSTVKRKNRRVSKAALMELEKLLGSHSNKKDAIKIWHDKTTNEHPEPLKQVWDWLREKRRSPSELMDRLAKNKFITVLKKEDREINIRGFRSKGSPEERHSKIVVVDMPVDIFGLIELRTKIKT
jgi:hypothetical protein